MGVWDIERPPAGVDDTFSRAFVRLLNARLDALPIERVLVWHLASVAEVALPHLAEGLGLDDLAWVSAPPREFIGRAVELLRRRGTPAAVEEAVALLGYAPASVELEERMARSRNGDLLHSGNPWNHGADFGPGVAWLWVDMAATPSIAQRLELWDVANFMRRFSSRIVLVITTPSGTIAIRERWEIK